MSSTYSLAGGIVDNTPYQAELDGVPYLQQTDCLLPGAWPAEADRVPSYNRQNVVYLQSGPWMLDNTPYQAEFDCGPYLQQTEPQMTWHR